MLLQDMPAAEYERKVKRLVKRRDGEPLYNNCAQEQAVTILRHLLESAQESACILTGYLNRDVYGREDVVEAAKRLLAGGPRKPTIKMLIEDEDVFSIEGGAQHPFIQVMSSCPDHRQVDLRVVSKEMQARYKFHFAVMDRDSYRFEPDKNCIGAVAAFGDAKGGEHLMGLFDQLWAESQPPGLHPVNFDPRLLFRFSAEQRRGAASDHRIE